MKKFLVFLGVLLFFLAGCSPQSDAEQAKSDGPQANPTSETSVESAFGGDISTPDPSAYLEASNGPLTARIFSAQETTINQQEFVLQGWTNRAGVVSVNETIITNAAGKTFLIKLNLEDGPNLIEVVISDLDGNEVRFELIVFVE